MAGFSHCARTKSFANDLCSPCETSLFAAYRFRRTGFGSRLTLSKPDIELLFRCYFNFIVHPRRYGRLKADDH